MACTHETLWHSSCAQKKCLQTDRCPRGQKERSRRLWNTTQVPWRAPGCQFLSDSSERSSRTACVLPSPYVVPSGALCSACGSKPQLLPPDEPSWHPESREDLLGEGCLPIWTRSPAVLPEHRASLSRPAEPHGKDCLSGFWPSHRAPPGVRSVWAEWMAAPSLSSGQASLELCLLGRLIVHRCILFMSWKESQSVSGSRSSYPKSNNFGEKKRGLSRNSVVLCWQQAHIVFPCG